MFYMAHAMHGQTDCKKCIYQFEQKVVVPKSECSKVYNLILRN